MPSRRGLAAIKGWKIVIMPWLIRPGRVSFPQWEAAVDRIENAIARAEGPQPNASLKQVKDWVGKSAGQPSRQDLREWLLDQTRTYQHSERLRAFREILELLEGYEVDVQIVLCACCDRPATRDVEGQKLCDVCKR